MMEFTRESISLEGDEIRELALIVVDNDKEAAYRFLKERIYQRIMSAQQMRLEHRRLREL